jgi:transcriptional regulator with XRE-family HTH domain
MEAPSPGEIKMRNNKLGGIIKIRRKALGWTQRTLAKKLGIEASHAALMEQGLRKPSLKLVPRIADTLGLDRQEVLTWLIRKRRDC